MKKHHSTQKVLLIGVLAVVAIAGVIFVKNRFGGMSLFKHTSHASGDLMIINDSSDSISVEYKKGGKEGDKVVQPGEKVTGGKGFIRIFTAKKSGGYEVMYEFPRPSGAKQEVALSDIIAAAKRDKMEGELYTKRGAIDDIQVFYEEVEEE
jgi:hypothetical protein